MKLTVLLLCLSFAVEAQVLRAAAPYRPDIVRHAQFYFGIPAPVPLISGQIMQESAFNPKVVSRVGARGIMQFMPSTAEWAAKADQSLGRADPLNPKWAIRAGIWYDRYLWERLDEYEPCSRWGATLSSYNGGLGWHNKRQEMADDPTNFWDDVRVRNPGITTSNQQENESYPLRIVTYWQPQFRLWGKMVCIS